MRQQLDRYIRSLAERERAGDAPAHQQDVGTLVCWLLPRLGFSIHVAAYKYQGAERMKSAGRAQWGVDVLASRADEDGVERSWAFVLKHGDIGRSNWSPDTPGTLPNDMELAAGRPVALDASHAPGTGGWGRRTIVAVHNGSLDTEAIGGQVDSFLARLRDRWGVDVEWWSAERLLELCLQAPAAAGAHRLVDPGLFPPRMQPFVELSLSSLHLDPVGSRFDLSAVDRLIEARLPLGRVPDEDTEALRDGTPLAGLVVRRAATELALFAGLVEVQAIATARDSALPTLETVERVSCRIIEHVRRLDPTEAASHRADLRAVLNGLMDQYLARASSLRDRLAEVMDIDAGLALAAPGEAISYPLRAYRLGGHLAVGGHIAADRDDLDGARLFAGTLEKLWATNPGGFLAPLTDDHAIEIQLIWELWLRLGMWPAARRESLAMIRRLILRRRMGQPLPATWVRARWPLDGRSLDQLVAAYQNGREGAPASFNDAGSSLLPLSLAVAWLLGERFASEDFDALRSATETGANGVRRTRPGVAPQTWRPPSDVADEWYVREVAFRGDTAIHRWNADLGAMVAEILAAAEVDLVPSAAALWRVPAIDLMAFRLHRTPPPLGRLIKLVIASDGHGRV